MRRNAVIVVALVAALLSATRPVRGQAPPPVVTTPLTPGWNNVAYVGATRPIAQALGFLAGRYEVIWTWDTAAQRWRGFNPVVPQAADFTELRQNQAYWIRMTLPGDLAMEVPPANGPVILSPGWNNFVYPGFEQPVADALAVAAGRFNAVWRWESSRQGWSGYTPASPLASDFSTFVPFRSYFMQLGPGPSLAMAPTAAPTSTPAPVPVATPLPPATRVPVPTPVATPTPSARRDCYKFQAYQPALPEVSRALTRAGFGTLVGDTDFRLDPIKVSPSNPTERTAAYIPPTLLKAISWVESGWRQASFGTARGTAGPTIVSTSCAYGVMQILSGMTIAATPSAKQEKIGSDYQANIAAAAQLLVQKWNYGPDYIPVASPRNPRIVESWYFTVWSYHCFGEVCEPLGIRNNPDDPALKWPRPVYNSGDQQGSGGQFTFTDYPYQELVYGVIANPPVANGTALWPALPVRLPDRGAAGYPEPKPFTVAGVTVDPTSADGP